MDFCDVLNWKTEIREKEKERIRSFHPEMDTFLGGGLPLSSLTECGMPMGKEGRHLLLPFLANITQGRQFLPAHVLWVNGYGNLEVFAPAWFARGLCPEKTVFARTETVMVDLKRVFLASLFKLIVIDTPEFLSLEDKLFLRRMAQKNSYAVVILHNGLLSNAKGNIASSLRFNVWREPEGSFLVQGVKGVRGQISV